MVIHHEGLASIGKGGKLVEVRVLERPGRVDADRMEYRANAVVGVGKDQVASGSRRERSLEPGLPQLCPRRSCRAGQLLKVEDFIEVHGVGGQYTRVRQCGRVPSPGGNDCSEAVI